MNYHFFADIICDETVFQETHLSSPAKCEALEQLLPPGTRVRFSNNIMCQAGGVCRGSFEYGFDSTSNHNVLVTLTAFLEVTPDGFEPLFFYVVLAALEASSPRVENHVAHRVRANAAHSSSGDGVQLS